MKQLHTFDEVFDSQKAFRGLLEAMANPGRTFDISLQKAKLFGDEPAMLVLAMTLLDASVSFCAPENPDLTEQILLLTHARPVSAETADYLFISDGEQLSSMIQKAKDGTLENPHTSATVIVNVSDNKEGQPVYISGPGVAGRMEINVAEDIAEAVALRDKQEYEYPKGIDYIFLLPESQVLCVPRLVKMEVC